MKPLKHISKAEALTALGDGTVVGAARALGITPQAVSSWADPLTERTGFRVITGLFLRAPSPVQRGVQVLLFGSPEPAVQRAASDFLAVVAQEGAAEPAG